MVKKKKVYENGCQKIEKNFLNPTVSRKKNRDQYVKKLDVKTIKIKKIIKKEREEREIAKKFPKICKNIPKNFSKILKRDP